MNRRRFLKSLVYSAGGILIAEELLVNRTYFLPPRDKYGYSYAFDMASYDDFTVWMKVRLVEVFGVPYNMIETHQMRTRGEVVDETVHTRRTCRCPVAFLPAEKSMPSEGWLCPACGGAHAPSVLTCPGPSVSTTQWAAPNMQDRCPGCGKPRRFSIPRLGIWSIDHCMCPTAGQTLTTSDRA